LPELCAAGFAPAAEGFLAYREKDTKIRLVNLHLYTVKSRQQELSFYIKSSKKVPKLLKQRRHRLMVKSTFI
jgi:hypothetical protein